MLQRPQLPLSLPTLTSQPLAAMPSQSAKPAAQAPIPHAPASQVAAALAKRHATPHAPQWFRSAPRTLSSQPSAALPLQSAKPLAQAPTTHAPAAQALTVTFASAHAASHAPQCRGSVMGDTQPPPQLVRPAPHEA